MHCWSLMSVADLDKFVEYYVRYIVYGRYEDSHTLML